jgi:hypothetical protein
MARAARRLLVWLFVRGRLTSERLAGLFRRHPWLRSA